MPFLRNLMQMPSKSRVAAMTVVLLMAVPVLAADFEFAVVGDTCPRFESEGFLQFESLMEKINALRPALVVNVGESKADSAARFLAPAYSSNARPSGKCCTFPARKHGACRWPEKQTDGPDCVCFPPDET